jgi:hypothetical protein
MMPDPDFYRQCLQESFDELLSAANSRTKAATAAKSKKATGTKPKRAA